MWMPLNREALGCRVHALDVTCSCGIITLQCHYFCAFHAFPVHHLC